jgi:deoxyribose-phosphate aldolase
MVDLTTLEGQDTPGKVRALSAKAMRPDPADPSCPQVAAVCVYPDLVPVEQGDEDGVDAARIVAAGRLDAIRGVVQRAAGL